MTNQELIYQQLEQTLPAKWFHQLRNERSGPLYPLLWGIAGAIAQFHQSYAAAQDQSIPAYSSGFWLSLHMRGLGLERRGQETDAQGFARYQAEFSQTRNTVAGLTRTLERLTGLAAPYVRVETDFNQAKYGQLRVVVASADAPQSLPWRETDYGWVSEFISRFVANGIVPSLEIKAKCLLLQKFRHYDYATTFPMSFETLGPAWERPTFIQPVNYDFASNLVLQATEEEWAQDGSIARQLYRDTHQNNEPGGLFFYLTNKGHCPYRALNFDPPYPPAPAKSDRPFVVEGFTYFDSFPRPGAQDRVTVEPEVITASFNRPAPFTGNYERCWDYYDGYPHTNQPINPQVNVALPTVPSLLAAIALPTVPSLTIQPEYVPLDSVIRSQRFYYYRETVTGGATLQPIPDTLTLNYQEQAETSVANNVVAWRRRGNHQVGAPQISVGPPVNVVPSTYGLPNGYSLPGGLTIPTYNATGFGLVSPITGAFFTYSTGFEQGQEFLTIADDPTTWLNPDAAITYTARSIPNVRAGFTRGNIIKWCEILGAVVPGDNARIRALSEGPWFLTLGQAPEDWEFAPRPQLDNVRDRIAKLAPSSIWWTNEAGTARSNTPIYEKQIAYLAVEFLLPRSVERNITEIQLSLGGAPKPAPVTIPVWEMPESYEVAEYTDKIDYTTAPDWTLPFPLFQTVEYKVSNLEIDAQTNFGILYQIATQASGDIDIKAPAFRTGRSTPGEVLRDRDYVAA